MRMIRLSKWGLIVMLFLAVWNVGQAQDSLGMSCLSSLEYWQGADKIQMVGDLAYVVGSSAMHIVSLADPANPVAIGRFTWYQWWDTGGGVYVVGSCAYLGTRYGGFVLDVFDPTQPAVLGQWTSGIGSVISFVHGDYAIAQTDEGYAYVLDISDPTNVHYVCGFPGNGTAWEAMGMAGEYLCMSGAGLTVWDMSNPAEPQWVASVDTTFGVYYGMISGNHGYLATQYNGLRIIDLSNPLQPVEVAACDSGGWTWDVTVTGSDAVVLKGTVSENQLDVWNIADPAHPVFEGSIGTETTGPHRVASSGNLVCATGMRPYYAVTVVDISSPAAPVEVSSFGPGGGVSRMEIVGSIAYGAGIGLRTMDISDPHHLSELTHTYPICGSGLDVAIRGNYAYLVEHQSGMGTDGMVVFEVNNPAEPESLGCVLQEGIQRIVIAGDYAYLAGGQYLYTFSLANPAVPQCVNILSPPTADSDLGLGVLNGYLYYGAWSSLYVYSLSNPAAPQLMGSCNLGGGSWVFDLAAAGHYVYVARGGYGGMRIVDVEDPAHPSEVNWINGFWVVSVAADGNIAIMDDRTRISVYDVTYPEDPRLVGYYATDEYITDMEIQGQHLFTTSGLEFRAYQCDALSGVPSHPEMVPHEFALYPSYPNPFNAVTSISYEVPVTGLVSISIYNVLGQHLTTLVNDLLTPGTYSTVWNAANLPSGIYFCRMETMSHSQVRKLLLVR